MIVIFMLVCSCSTTVHINSDSQVREKVDLLAIGPKNIKEIKGVNFPYNYKIKDNNVPQLVLISSNSNAFIYDSIWIEVGSRNINENWAPPAIMFATLTLGVATPILKYMWADVPSKKYYTTRGIQLDAANSYKLDEEYRELNLTLLAYQLLENNEFEKAYLVANYLINKNPSAEMYYLRAISNLKNKEKKKALKDFKKALEYVNSDSQTWITNEIYYNINLIENQMNSERKQKWESLGSAILTMGQAAVNIYYQHNNSSLIGMGNYIDNSLLDPNLAISQIKNQLYYEYLEFMRFNKKQDGSDYSFGDWMAIKGQAINDANSGHTTFSDSYNSNSGSSGSSTKSYTPDCHLCHGLGKCNTCNGTHSYLNPLTDTYITCPNCKPDGLCSACGGTGKKR